MFARLCLLVLAIMLVGVAALKYADHHAEATCRASGGNWLIVGQHDMTVYQTIGRVLVPVTYKVDDMGCTH